METELNILHGSRRLLHRIASGLDASQVDRLPPGRQCAESDDDVRALAVFIDAMERALAEIDIGYVPPPLETIGPLGLTRSKYTLGSTRLASGRAHPEDDFSHMNGEYGELVLRDLMKRIGVPALTA